MTQETQSKALLLSALVDGRLRGEEFASTVAWLEHDEDARLTWQAYHLVGDVLRSGESIVRPREAAFLQRVTLGLRQEVALTAQVRAAGLRPGRELAARPGPDGRSARGANDARARWKLFAGLASLALAAVTAWQLVGGPVDPGIAQQVMLRDPQLDALLAAHRQSGGASALQMSAGFLRNATFEGSSR